MAKLTALTVLFFIAAFCRAQNLTGFTLSVGTARPFISFGNKKTYSAGEAAAVKQALDFMLLVTKDGSNITRELYNMSGKDDKTPRELNGTASGIISVNWDTTLWAKCKTSGDLKRMTGYLTANSFSHYAVLGNNAQGEITNPWFVFISAAGKRGVFKAEKGKDDAIVLSVKMEE